MIHLLRFFFKLLALPLMQSGLFFHPPVGKSSISYLSPVYALRSRASIQLSMYKNLKSLLLLNFVNSLYIHKICRLEKRCKKAVSFLRLLLIRCYSVVLGFVLQTSRVPMALNVDETVIAQYLGLCSSNVYVAPGSRFEKTSLPSISGFILQTPPSETLATSWLPRRFARRTHYFDNFCQFFHQKYLQMQY